MEARESAAARFEALISKRRPMSVGQTSCRANFIGAYRACGPRPPWISDPLPRLHEVYNRYREEALDKILTELDGYVPARQPRRIQIDWPTIDWVIEPEPVPAPDPGLVMLGFIGLACLLLIPAMWAAL